MVLMVIEIKIAETTEFSINLIKSEQVKFVLCQCNLFLIGNFCLEPR
jgi:hypothetical protein